MIKGRSWIVDILLFPLVLIFMYVGTVTARSSPSYNMPKDVLDSGGAPSTSTTYSLNDAVGQPSAIGGSTSTNYSLMAGFFASAVSSAGGYDIAGEVNRAL